MTDSTGETHGTTDTDEKWPPDGFSQPQKIPELPWLRPLAIAVTIAIPLLMIFQSSIGQFADPWVADIEILLNLTDNPSRELSIILRSVIGILSTLVAVIILTIVAHEFVHYITAWGMGLNPEFCWVKSKFLKNPAVITVDVETTRLQHAFSLLSPFFLIGISGLLAWWYIGGFLSATAAIVVMFNCPASGKDLYTAYWLARLPSGTKFATFKKDSGYHSVYSVPAANKK